MNGNGDTDIRACSPDDLLRFLNAKGEPAFRLKQINEWLWKKGVRQFEEMSTLPRELRKVLTDSFSLTSAEVERIQESADGTEKFVFSLKDQLFIESVLIPADTRNTACISSQAGCALGCHFCATGLMGFYRNLTTAEMFDQVFVLNQRSVETKGNPLSNIVLMGMGEPLFNYPNIKRFISLITHPDYLGFSPQRITLSTIGVPKMIRTMADDDLPVQLAVSLHAAEEGLRNQIMPFNRQHSLAQLAESLVYYHQLTGRRITMEYLLMKGVNDSLEAAASLARYCRQFPVKINLIEYNPVPAIPYDRTEIRQLKAFRDFLLEKNMVVNVRKSRGKDIDAACGQLSTNQMKRSS